jgi:hypothetical protein
MPSDAIVRSLEKTGSARMVNPKHPLVTTFAEYCDTLGKLAEVRVARDDTKSAHDEILGTLKQANQAASLVGKLHSGSKAVAEHASKALHPLIGETGAKIVRGAGSVVVPGAALIGANELRRHAKYSPTVHKGLRYVPGTDDYREKNMELAQRAQMGQY